MGDMMRNVVYTSDRVDVVRCRDCQNWKREWEANGVAHFCPMMDYYSEPNFFCADGKRRNEDGKH